MVIDRLFYDTICFFEIGRWVMHYQDHLTKFSILRPLKSKRAAEVAYQLTDIFLLLGAPHILQSDNGREFIAAEP
jgi:hypothetical protein